MELLIIIGFGIACGLVMPYSKKTSLALFVTGCAALGLVTAIYTLTGQSSEDIMRLLKIDPNPTKDSMGLVQLVGVGYICVIGAGLCFLKGVIKNTDGDKSN